MTSGYEDRPDYSVGVRRKRNRITVTDTKNQATHYTFDDDERLSTVTDPLGAVIVSATVPTFNSALTGAVNAAVSSMPSRWTVLKPVRENVTEYVPGLRLMIL